MNGFSLYEEWELNLNIKIVLRKGLTSNSIALVKKFPAFYGNRMFFVCVEECMPMEAVCGVKATYCVIYRTTAAIDSIISYPLNSTVIINHQFFKRVEIHETSV